MRGLFGGAAQVIRAVFGGLTGAALIFFLAVFFAWEPALYKSSIVSLVPADRRARFADVLSKARSGLAWWLAGQGISMALIFVLTFILLTLVGMPLALLLAVQAGLLAFIPILGPFLAGVVIVVVGLAESPFMALYGLGAYLLIQFVETNFLAPIVQERTVRLPPAFTLAFQLVFAVLFGFLGLALAVPIAAAGKVFIEELYVKDRLGGFWEE
jgi:predicted PurR-regulated permease PerM